MNTIREFVAKLKELFAELRRSNGNTRNHLVELESNIFIYKLQTLLEQFKNSEQPLNPISLKPFTDLLAIRWGKILHTDAIYMHQPNSTANKQCIVMGKLLAEILRKDLYELLMPGIGLYYRTSKGNLTKLDLHEFVLADDGATPIEILPCLKAARVHPVGSLYHVCTDGRDALPLTVGEGTRVINHSENALSFYRKSNDKLIEDLKDPKKYVVQSSYGINGNKKLASELVDDLLVQDDLLSITISQVKLAEAWGNLNKIIACIVERATSPDYLFDFMRTRVAKRDWKAFLLEASEVFSSRQTSLLDFLLGDQADLLSLTKKNSIYRKDSDSYNRIVLLALSQLYADGREAVQGQYTGTMKFFSNIVGDSVVKYVSETADGYSYTSEEKKAAVELFQAFLLSTHRLNDLDGFLQDHLAKFKDNVTSRHVGALRQGQLGAIAAQAKICCDAGFYQAVESRGILGLGIAGL